MASSSICPKGWRLPVSGFVNTSSGTLVADTSRSFYKLLTAYGYSGVINQPVTGDGRTRLDYVPMYFVRSGAQVGGVGSEGNYWSSYKWNSVTSSGGVLRMRLEGSVNMANNSIAASAFSVRCLAR